MMESNVNESWRGKDNTTADADIDADADSNNRIRQRQRQREYTTPTIRIITRSFRWIDRTVVQ